MHGLINRSIQCFVGDTYGSGVWGRVTQAAELDDTQFEAMLSYEDAITFRILDETARCLQKPVDAVLEDLGTYLVSHPNVEALRRLLRFGGESFIDFVYSLDDLRGRARLAVPDLELPQIEVVEVEQTVFRVNCIWTHPGFAHVLVGVLRAMADDYGALVYLEHRGTGQDGELVEINLLDMDFATGRPFHLTARAG